MKDVNKYESVLMDGETGRYGRRQRRRDDGNG